MDIDERQLDISESQFAANQQQKDEDQALAQQSEKRLQQKQAEDMRLNRIDMDRVLKMTESSLISAGLQNRLTELNISEKAGKLRIVDEASRPKVSKNRDMGVIQSPASDKPNDMFIRTGTNVPLGAHPSDTKSSTLGNVTNRVTSQDLNAAPETPSTPVSTAVSAAKELTSNYTPSYEGWLGAASVARLVPAIPSANPVEAPKPAAKSGKIGSALMSALAAPVNKSSEPMTVVSPEPVE
jgi:hypothetical protein